jgi:hypothetical protein
MLKTALRNSNDRGVGLRLTTRGGAADREPAKHPRGVGGCAEAPGVLSHLGHKVRLERTYERFLELPVPVVLMIMWLAGLVLVGLCALAFYFVFRSLVLVVAGV